MDGLGIEQQEARGYPQVRSGDAFVLYQRRLRSPV
jgi:hypothetical protein